MKNRELKAIVAVADELHFGRAAERLGIAQPQLSELIRRVEDEAGFSIFDRRPRVRVTHAGEVILTTARRVLAELETGTARARSVAAGLAGGTSLGFSPVAMASDLPTILRSFSEANPAIDLRLIEGTTNALRSQLRLGELDFAITREPLRDDGIETSKFAHDEVNLLVPKDHPLATSDLIEPSSLADEQFTMFPRSAGPEYYDRLLAWCRKAGLKPNITRETESWLAVAALVGAGFGMSFGTKLLSRIEVPGVAYRRFAGSPHDVSFWLAWRANGLSPAALKLLQHLQSSHTT